MNRHIIKFIYKDQEDDNWIDLAFDHEKKEAILKRKEWLTHYMDEEKQ